jgi:hypothetical protein
LIWSSKNKDTFDENSSDKMTAPTLEEKFTADVVLINGTPIGVIDEETIHFVGLPMNKPSADDPEQKFSHTIEHSPEEEYFYSDLKNPIDISMWKFYQHEINRPFVLCRISDKKVEIPDVSIERRELTRATRHCDPLGLFPEIQLADGVEALRIFTHQNLEFHYQLAIYYIRRATGLDLPCALKQIPEELTVLDSYSRPFGFIDRKNNLLYSNIFGKEEQKHMDNIVCAFGCASEMDTRFPLESVIFDEEEIQRMQKYNTLISYCNKIVVAHFDKEEQVIQIPRVKKYETKVKLGVHSEFDLVFELENDRYCSPKIIYQRRGDWLIRCFDQIESKDRQIMKEKISFNLWKIDGAVWETLFGDGQYRVSQIIDPFRHKLLPRSPYFEIGFPAVTFQPWIDRQFPNFARYNSGYRVSLIKRTSLDEYFPDYVIPDLQNLIFEFVCDGFIDDLDDPESRTSGSLRKLYENHLAQESDKPDDYNPLRDLLLKGILAKSLNRS